MSEIRFKNLPLLLKDMEEKNWIIDSFLFNYNEMNTVVILRRYKQNQRKPREHAKAEIEFIKLNNLKEIITGYIDFYEVYFNNAEEFYDFFYINKENKNAGRKIFINFAEYFSKFIPREKKIEKENINEKRILATRTEKREEGIYCYNVRRTGIREDGSPNQRTIENSNKAELLRPNLYRKYKKDTSLSFFFSSIPEKELSDEKIIENVAKRKYI